LESPRATYTVTNVVTVSGAPLGLSADGQLFRFEASSAPPQHVTGLTGVAQHLGYTEQPLREALVAASRTELRSGSAVLIPITKSKGWWDLAQDQRLELLRSKATGAGHFEIGQRYSHLIYRRLLHARYVPHSQWDFLTYFEFPSDLESAFRELLAELRDPVKNPEWCFVERESEVWLRYD
jgi:hypothetical protein